MIEPGHGDGQRTFPAAKVMTVCYGNGREHLGILWMGPGIGIWKIPKVSG